MPPSLLRPALVLGLLAAVGPFAIDMYLPAMPAIGADLSASPRAIQGTLVAYFAAFGVAQMVYGPWSDQAGRKPPLYAGLAVFLIGTALCALAPDARWLTLGRLVQGLGGAAVMVIPRAVIRDLATGADATRMMAAIMVVISVSPMLAPLTGAALLAVADWRAIFWALMLAAGASLILTRAALGETLPPAARRPVEVRAMLAGLRRLLTDRGFMTLTLLGGFGMASFFVFLAAASFVYTGQFGLSPTGFSLAFALNAVGFFGASQLAARLGQAHGPVRVVVAATAGFAGTAVALFGLGLAGGATLPVTMTGLFLANAFLGLVIPTAMVLALEEHGAIAGLASSLGGTIQMVAGGAMIAAAGPFLDGTAVPMLGAIALCAALAFLLSRMIPRQAAPARSAG